MLLVPKIAVQAVLHEATQLVKNTLKERFVQQRERLHIYLVVSVPDNFEGLFVF